MNRTSGIEQTPLVSQFHKEFDIDTFTDHPAHDGNRSIVFRAWSSGTPPEERVPQRGDPAYTAYDAFVELLTVDDFVSVELLESWGHGAGSALMDHVRLTHGDGVDYQLGEAAYWPDALPFLQRYENRTGWWPQNVHREPLAVEIKHEVDVYLKQHYRLFKKKEYIDVDGGPADCGEIADRIGLRLQILGENPSVLMLRAYGNRGIQAPRGIGDDWYHHTVCVNRGEVLDPLAGKRLPLRSYLESTFSTPVKVYEERQVFPDAVVCPLDQLIPRTQGRER